MNEYCNNAENIDFSDGWNDEYIFMVILYPKPRKSILAGTLNPSTRFFSSREESCEYLFNIAKSIYIGNPEDLTFHREENQGLFNYLNAIIKGIDDLRMFRRELELFYYIPSNSFDSVNHIEIKKVPHQKKYIKSSNKQ